MGSLSPPAHLHGDGRSTSASASFQHNGCRAGRLACWHNVTAERSRPVPSHFIPPSHEPWSTQQPSSEHSPRRDRPLVFARCNPPVLVWANRVRRPTEKHFMHVPRYGIPQTTSWSRAIAKTRGQATETCSQTFPCLFPTRGLSLPPTHKTFEIFSRLPHLLMPSLVLGVPTLQSARHVSVKTIRLLGVVRTIYPFKRWA